MKKNVWNFVFLSHHRFIFADCYLNIFHTYWIDNKDTLWYCTFRRIPILNTKKKKTCIYATYYFMLPPCFYKYINLYKLYKYKYGKNIFKIDFKMFQIKFVCKPLYPHKWGDGKNLNTVLVTYKVNKYIYETWKRFILNDNATYILLKWLIFVYFHWIQKRCKFR